jgi:hypothetical protein
MAVLELRNGKKENVFPFSEDYTAVQDVPIATICIVWEDPRRGIMDVGTVPRGTLLASATR